MEQNKEQGGVAVRGEAVAGHEAHFARLTLIRASGDEELIEAVKMGEVSIQAALKKVVGATSVVGSSTDWRIYHSALSKCADLLDNMADNDALIDVPVYLAAKLSARAADAPAEPSEPTDLSHRLRETADQQPGWKQLLNAAADEIERYYGGMLAWKKTAEKKDADWNAIVRAADALDSQPTESEGLPPLPEPIEVGGEGWDFDDFKSEKTFSCEHMWAYARAAIASSQPTDGGVRNGSDLKAVHAFLMGESPLEGVQFGDKHPTKAGAFWWRLNLRAALAKG